MTEDQAIRAARAHMTAAHDSLIKAVKALRDGGLPMHADMAMADPRRVMVWLQPDGFLDHLAAQAPAPDPQGGATERGAASDA